MDEYDILLVWDDEATRWIAENDDIPIALNLIPLMYLLSGSESPFRNYLNLMVKTMSM